MSAPNNGGPAFPMPGNEVQAADYGMSLRDYFAAQALVAIMSNPETYHHGPSEAAAGAFEYANAMLAERAKRGAK